jgi:hypothetical protein
MITTYGRCHFREEDAAALTGKTIAVTWVDDEDGEREITFRNVQVAAGRPARMLVVFGNVTGDAPFYIHLPDITRIEDDEPAVYLTAADLADHFGVPANSIHAWRARYGPERDAAAIAKAPVMPAPDCHVGVHRPQAVWAESRLPELDAWRASLPGQGKGGGRPALRRTDDQ